MNTQNQLLIEKRQSVPSKSLVSSNPVQTDEKPSSYDEFFAKKGFLMLSGFSQPDLKYACDGCGSIEVLVSWNNSDITRKCLDCNQVKYGISLQ